jgi:hypothetical protein
MATTYTTLPQGKALISLEWFGFELKRAKVIPLKITIVGQG